VRVSNGVEAMKAKRYFQISLFLPLIVPSVCGLIVLVTGKWGSMMDGSLVYELMGVLWFSLLYGGGPYLVFLAGALIWSRHETVERIQGFTFVAPLIYALILGASVILFCLITVDADGMSDAFPFGLFGIVFGYLYVIPVNALYGLLKHMELVRTEEDPPRPEFFAPGFQAEQDNWR